MNTDGIFVRFHVLAMLLSRRCLHRILQSRIFIKNRGTVGKSKFKANAIRCLKFVVVFVKMNSCIHITE